MTSPIAETLPVFLAAKWDDGSFLRLPGRWLASGVIEVVRNDWAAQVPQPLLEKRHALLVAVTVHLPNENFEMQVAHRAAQDPTDGPEKITMFKADRAQLLRTVPACPTRYLKRVPLLSPVDTNDIEQALVGVLGVIGMALRGPQPRQSTAVKSLADIYKVLGPLHAGFPVGIPTKLLDGSELLLPTRLTGRLAACVEYTANRTAPLRWLGAAPEYAAYLVLEECERNLLHGLKQYGKEHFACRKALLAGDPDMGLLLASFGTLEEDGACGWPGAESFAQGMALLGRRAAGPRA